MSKVPDREEFWGIPDEFPYEFGPDSPLDSALSSSTETESDEDEFLSGLTHHLTRSTLLDKPAHPTRFESIRVTESSPNATLSGLNYVSKVVPQTMPFGVNEDALDMLFSAVGQVARLKMSGEVPPQPMYPSGRGLINPNQAHLLPLKATTSGFYPPQRENIIQHQVKQGSYGVRGRCVGFERLLGVAHNSAWLQHNNNNSRGMRAVFLNGVKRGSAGTGVFLPRRYDNDNASRKKPNCSNVLVPAKVLHSQPCYNVGYVSNYDVFLAPRNATLAQQKPSLRVDGRLNHEIHLPQEWTY